MRGPTRIIERINTSLEKPFNFSEELPDILHQAVKRLETSNQTDDIQLVTAYCAARLIYSNGQSSGVVENLTTEEFLRRTEDPDTGEIIICRHHHKTGPQGVAQIVIDKTTDQIMES